ncbi:hypothetical protein [Rhodovulum sulfidophilum]|uniref:hypothetical protein n=1 Tax=Rhodovulum sulfidophilum TaxID=35806 RepID=UPI000950CCCA|nr:hypothetical protein [Rhodovulum sulfidophilum]MBL3553864.1 hypothetical protein [Rhodovulum sulfidophilum]OLS46983.1 hypothetical protein BV379_00885 [Rhodovulum sulfidophilum]
MKMLVHRQSDSTELPFVMNDLLKFVALSEDDADFFSELEPIGKAAAEEIEKFAQIALLNQTVRVTIFDPVKEYGLSLPIGPVAEDKTPIVTIDGEVFTGFDFVGGNRPYIRWFAKFYDLTPSRMTIEYEAGFGDTAADIPADLYQALMDQAALHFGWRSPLDAKSLTNSPHMARIAARYRGVQV